jgi:DNA-damage-inducible protein D
VQEHFKQYTHDVKGQILSDYKLTRFACYLATLNADVKKPNVARAQVYFASLAQVIQQHIENTENVERVLIRQEITDREKSLSGIAKVRQVENYASFCNAGYIGMYNMSIGQIRKLKGISNKETPLDFMGKRELAANLFRITETEGRIKDDAAIVGQTRLETIARKVGSEIRGVMKVPPEVLAQQGVKDIKAVKKNIKNTSKKLIKLDSPQHKQTASK